MGKKPPRLSYFELDAPPTRITPIGEGPEPVASSSPPSSDPSPIEPGVRIRLQLLRTRETTRRVEDLGVGRLLAPLQVGKPAEASLERGDVLVTSPLRGVFRLGPAAVQVVTRNSIYRIERLDPAE